MKTKLIKFLMGTLMMVFVLNTCKKDEAGPTGTVQLGITDTRTNQEKTDNGIIDATKLTKFEITISKINFLTEGGGQIEVLNQAVSVDLRNFKGNVKDLVSCEIPMGNYIGLQIFLTGVSITYDGNSYISSVENGASLTLADLPGTTFTTANGIPNIFSIEQSLSMSFEFEITEELNNRTLNLTFDAVAACTEISFPCDICGGTQYFAKLRDFLPLGYYFEEGIQEIKHSPPLGIELTSGTTASYYGIHTFVDFKGIGGTINSHTSQHIYRGEDGLSSVEAENEAVNSSALSTSTINASGQTNVRADEVFNFSTIKTNMSGKGINLLAGKKYYFSLKKKWTITSGNTIYTISRTCEPIPVLWPAL